MEVVKLAEGSTLRIDNFPLEDFLVILNQYERDVRNGYLPKQSFLKEFKLECLWEGEGLTSPVHLSLYCLEELETLSDILETFVIVSTRSEASRAIIAFSKKLKDTLTAAKKSVLFRIDPRFGLVHGSAVEPIDPSIKWDKPGIYTALYLTDDPSSPSIAVMEYVSQENLKRFISIFEKYNGIPPKKPSFWSNALGKLTGKSKSTDTEKQRKINYKLVKTLVNFLQRERAMSATISLIFKNLEPEDVPNLLVDKMYLITAKSGSDRFFGTLADLI